MAKTLVWPPKIVHGGAAMTSGPDEANRQAIRLALTRGPSGNAFHDSPALPVFEPLSQRTEAAVRHHVEGVFRGLERDRRARLIAVSFARDQAAGDLVVNVEYLDLETTRRDRMELPLG